MSSGIYLLRDSNRLTAARELRLLDALPKLPELRDQIYYKEGIAATVSVTRINEHLSLRVGGKPDATSFGDMSTQVTLSLVPEILHAKGAEEVLVIGMGSGVTVGAALAPDTVKRVDVVEMSPEVIEASAFFARFNGLNYSKPPQKIWLDEPKVDVMINDGRNHLLLTSRTYDAIVSEPSNPWLAGIGNLFTREAFELARKHLKPGGIMSQWLQSYSLQEENFFNIVHTFAEVFPHSQLWCVNKGDFLLIGSDASLDTSIERIRERLKQKQVASWLKRVNFDTDAEFAASYIAGGGVLKDKAKEGRLHTDDNMLLEFSAPRALYSRRPPLAGTQFLPMPEQFVNLTALPGAERGVALKNLDLAVAGREHLRYAVEAIGSSDGHYRAAYTVSPYQIWALEWRSRQDEARAQELLEETRNQKVEPDPAAALELLRAARDKSAAMPNFRGLLNRAVLQRATQLMKAGKNEEALRELDGADQNRRPELTELLRSEILVNLKKYDAALESLSKAFGLGASALECTERAGKVLVLAGRPLDAIATVDKVLEEPRAQFDPLAAPLWGLRADLLRGMQKSDQALQSIRVAMRVAPTVANYVHFEAVLLLAHGRLGEGLESYRRYAALDSENGLARAEVAGAAWRAAKDLPMESATQALELARYARICSREVCERNPEAQEGWKMLCRSFIVLAKYDPTQAEFYIDEAQTAYAQLLKTINNELSKLPDDLKKFGQ